MTRTLLFLALAGIGIGSAQQFGGGIMGPAVERDAGPPTRKVRPATASAPYWRGQYRCTMRTRIDDKGREWQHERCYWFHFGGVQAVDRKSLTGPVATLHAPHAGWWKRHLGDTAIHLGATSADAATSWGRPELHPLLRSADGRFGGRGLAGKLLIFGAVEGIKWTILRRDRGRWVRSLSLGPAAAFGSVAARNWRAR